MKLLFDQNLSYKLVNMLADVFPGSSHVRNCDLGTADDAAIWTFAQQSGYAIVSKDEDFHQRSFVYGHPPKVVWLRVGNCSTQRIAETLRSHHRALAAFDADSEASFLILS